MRLFEAFLLTELAGMEHLELETAAVFRDHAAPVARCLDGRIILVPGIGGAKFTRESARGGGCQTQRRNKLDGPRKVSAAVHWQQIPLLLESAAGRKGSTLFSRTFRGLAIKRWLPVAPERLQSVIVRRDSPRIERRQVED
jgi:hypothetical protein